MVDVEHGDTAQLRTLAAAADQALHSVEERVGLAPLARDVQFRPAVTHSDWFPHGRRQRMGVRHINPEGVHRSPAFSQAVVVEQPAKTIYIGGQNGVDADGKVVGPSVEEQARQAFRNLATILESEGASLANIVHWSIAVVDGHTFDEGVAAFQQYGSRPIHRPRSPSTSSPAWARLSRRDRRCRRRVMHGGAGRIRTSHLPTGASDRARGRARHAGDPRSRRKPRSHRLGVGRTVRPRRDLSRGQRIEFAF